MSIPIGLNVWSRLVEDAFPYLDEAAAPYDSLWFPDHVQYDSHKVAEGWSLLAYALARYPDKFCGHEVLCNNFRNPALLGKMVSTCQAISGGRVILGIGAGWNEEEFLGHTCEKAGLEKDHWKEKETKILKFEGIVFKEQSPSGSVVREKLNTT